MTNKNRKMGCLFPGKTVTHQTFGKGQVTAGMAVRFETGNTRIFDARWIRANCK